MSHAQGILQFWFGHPDEPNYGKSRSFWFIQNPEVDEELKTRFLKDYQQAAGYLDNWLNSPATCLALILLLDSVSTKYLSWNYRRIYN